MYGTIGEIRFFPEESVKVEKGVSKKLKVIRGKGKTVKVRGFAKYTVRGDKKVSESRDDLSKFLLFGLLGVTLYVSLKS